MNTDISTVKNTGVAGAQIAPSESAAPPQHQLPSGHPRPPSDAIALSTKARQLAASRHDEPRINMGIVEPGERTIEIGPRRLEVDTSGSYHLD